MNPELPTLKHYYPNIPTLGNVAISRHAQAQAINAGFNDSMIEDSLRNGTEVPDGQNVVFKEKALLRMVINKKPTPFKGAALCTTIIRLKPQEKAK